MMGVSTPHAQQRSRPRHRRRAHSRGLVGGSVEASEVGLRKGGHRVCVTEAHRESEWGWSSQLRAVTFCRRPCQGWAGGQHADRGSSENGLPKRLLVVVEAVRGPGLVTQCLVALGGGEQSGRGRPSPPDREGHPSPPSFKRLTRGSAVE